MNHKTQANFIGTAGAEAGSTTSTACVHKRAIPTIYYDTANNLIAMVKGNNTLHFYYDSSNSPIAFTRNNTMYYQSIVLGREI